MSEWVGVEMGVLDSILARKIIRDYVPKIRKRLITFSLYGCGCASVLIYVLNLV